MHDALSAVQFQGEQRTQMLRLILRAKSKEQMLTLNPKIGSFLMLLIKTLYFSESILRH